MEYLGRSLERAGFDLAHGTTLTAKRPGLVIHIEQLGLCWSSSDPSDYILPLIPGILGCKKELASVDELLSAYLTFFQPGRKTVVRVRPRLEMLSSWDCLRASGACGLAPDEYLVIRSLLGTSTGTCGVVTDFGVEGCSPFYAGRRLYYRSRLPASEVFRTLGVVGSHAQYNSYLPRDGVIEVERSSPDARGLADCLSEMGEWCSFIPAERESSNVRPEWPCSAPVV